MSKKIKQWLNELPEPYRSQAIINYSNFYETLENQPEESCMTNALIHAFLFKDTPEGWEYWHTIRTFYVSSELSDKIITDTSGISEFIKRAFNILNDKSIDEMMAFIEESKFKIINRI